MKKTILTLTAVAALAGAANAQVNLHVTVNETLSGGFTATAVGSYNVAGFNLDTPNYVLPSSGGGGIVSNGGLNLTRERVAGESLDLYRTTTGFTINNTWLPGSSVEILSTTNTDLALFSVGAPTAQLFLTAGASGTGTFTNTYQSLAGISFSDFNKADGVYNVTSSNGSLVSYELVSVPEPSSTALLGLGALGLLVRRKR